MQIISYQNYFLIRDSSGDFVGGKYSSKEAAELAIMELDVRLAEELWSKKIALNDQDKMLITEEDINSYKSEAYFSQ